MYKKAVILLTFLAYSLTLVHSLVPHHHHDEGKTVHGHQHHDDASSLVHHHADSGDHHHHNEDDDKTLTHVFADAIHNPASEVFVPAQESMGIQKKNKAVAILIVKLNGLLIPELKPPDWTFTYQEKYHSSNPDSFFLLRAPPVA